jgi:L-ascorbate metabolism protein UlaG (beta-lactamase superfamily)
VTDPMLSRTVGLVWPRRARPPVRAEDLAPVDGVLISHAHLDHCDLPTLKKLRRASGDAPPPVVVAHGFDDLIRKIGFTDVRTLRWYESTTLPCGAVVTAVPAAHFSGRTPWRPRTGFQGYVVEHAGAKVMFAGDTGACPRYPEVGRRFSSIDVALLPIGAYSPDSFRPVHMAPEDALDALAQLHATYLVPIHHATFRLSAEPMDEPARRLRDNAVTRGLADRVKLLAPGEAFAW